MRHWTFWEWLAYAGIFVAALIVTADTGFRLAPDVSVHLPAFFHSAWWGFAPVLLIVASTVILLLREFVFAPRTREFALTHVQAPTLPATPKTRVQEAPASAPERLFVGEDITPKYLVSFFEEHTDIQAKQLAKPFIGKWMRRSGRLTEVRVSSPEIGALVTLQNDDDKDPICFMQFDSPWLDRLSILRRGDRLTVIGQITTVESFGVTLDPCELVETL